MVIASYWFSGAPQSCASVRVVGPSGERDIPVEELITGYMTTGLSNDELSRAYQPTEA